ncbi:MAG: MoaD/ThiS family protein [Anaerolineae bacterium]|nr:MoaD/ThiS family protein [Anaerolineae bacterium]MDW8102976.1 MoaD/ThiS family protein [Anaerolineae bacterium]
MRVEVWLYGPLAKYGGGDHYAKLELDLPPETTVEDLLNRLGIPAEERGITFINGQLSAMPGFYPDLKVKLGEGDRIGIFHRRSMWPFQYRFGAKMHPEMEESIRKGEKGFLRHSYG